MSRVDEILQVIFRDHRVFEASSFADCARSLHGRHYVKVGRLELSMNPGEQLFMFCWIKYSQVS